MSTAGPSSPPPARQGTSTLTKSFLSSFFFVIVVVDSSQEPPPGPGPRDGMQEPPPGVETLLAGTAEPGEPLPHFSLIHELFSLELQAPAQWLFFLPVQK